MGVADFPESEWQTGLVGQEVAKLDFDVIPLFVDKELYRNYYNGFSNSVLWPLFHYFSSLVEHESSYFDAYVQVNRLFAEKLLPLIMPDDTIWIHDYQVLLLPLMLRANKFEVTIGLFLHIPFPSY